MNQISPSSHSIITAPSSHIPSSLLETQTYRKMIIFNVLNYLVSSLTSVYIKIYSTTKIFLLIPPTPRNISKLATHQPSPPPVTCSVQYTPQFANERKEHAYKPLRKHH